jgi:drug/metabolite transporter (DMT)-like permease
MTRRDFGIVALIAIPMTANNYLLNAAFGEIPVPLAVLIFYLWPALTTVAGWLMGRERFRWRTAAGLALAFVGVALALNVEFTAAQAKGVGYALGASVTWSLCVISIGQFFRGRDASVPSFYIMLNALLFFVIALAITGDVRLPHNLSGRIGMSSMGFLYAFSLIGVFAATVRMGAARAGFYMNFEPISTVILAALILGQTLAPIQLLGAALVISALFLFRPPPLAQRG